jgi:hypothetical protein
MISLGCLYTAATVGPILMLGVGIVQAAWVVPLWLYYRRAGEKETVKGILIAASVILLLNASCWGLLVTKR